MAKLTFTTTEEALAALNEPNPSVETMEAVREFLAAHKVTRVSSQLFKLADMVRERLAADPEFADEVRKLLDK
jgi:hypothetical protein